MTVPLTAFVYLRPVIKSIITTTQLGYSPKHQESNTQNGLYLNSMIQREKTRISYHGTKHSLTSLLPCSSSDPCPVIRSPKHTAYNNRYLISFRHSRLFPVTKENSKSSAAWHCPPGVHPPTSFFLSGMLESQGRNWKKSQAAPRPFQNPISDPWAHLCSFPTNQSPPVCSGQMVAYYN